MEKRRQERQRTEQKGTEGRTGQERVTHRRQSLYNPSDVFFECFPPPLHHVWVHVAKEVLLGQRVDHAGLGGEGSPELWRSWGRWNYMTYINGVIRYYTTNR